MTKREEAYSALEGEMLAIVWATKYFHSYLCGKEFLLRTGYSALPARISDYINAQYLLEFTYFGLDNIQHNYILFTEADLSHCSKGSITVCFADKAIYSTHIGMCEPSLFFQTTDHNISLQSKLLLHYTTLALQPHGSLWVYHFPEQQHVTLQCWKNGTWICRTEEFSGGGVLYNASRCCVAASGSQTYRIDWKAHR
jgi:hypothetical protein